VKKGILIGAAAVLVLVGVGYVAITLSGLVRFTPGKSVVGTEAAKTKMEAFVKDSLGVPAGTEIGVSDVAEDNGVYKGTITIQKKEYPMYLSLDGSRFFPNAISAEMIAKAQADATAQPAAQEVPKTAKPVVKLFVMSYCPYGTQIEKGILPVLDTLGDKIDFTLEFVSYAMHDKKELDENLRQYCIRTEEPSKLSAYLGCFLKKGQGTESACLKTAGVNVARNTSCVKVADAKFDVTKNFNDKGTYSGSFPPFNVDKADNDKYAVAGSPTLVVNGVVANSERDAASLLKTICSGFENAPAECAKTLPSTAPAPGFGEGTAAAGAATAAECGN
jgi:formylmethanofuran dehydrogenase subunit D